MSFRILSVLACFALLSGVSKSETLNVRDFGAKADGKTDDTKAFQDAIYAAEEAGGGTVLAPAGRYLLEGRLVIRPNVAVEGESFGTGGRHGTYLLTTAGKGQEDSPPFIRMIGGKNVLRGFVIEYPEQIASATEPIPYPWAIHVGPYSIVEDLHLYNPYMGLELDAAHACTVRNVWGEPLKIGLNADHIHDISRIENIHFWPFFTHDHPVMRQWVQDNATAFQFGRSDWQYAFNLFSYGYRIGYRFYESEDVPGTPLMGGTTNGNFVGIGADRCIVGIDVEAGFSIGISIVNGLFAPFGHRYSRAVHLRKGNTGNLTLSACNFWAVPDALFEVEGGSLNLSACNIQEWGLHGQGIPCFIASGGRLSVNGCTFNQGGLLARLTGEETRAIFTANMGNADGFTIENHIGDRAAIGLNNPAVTVVVPE